MARGNNIIVTSNPQGRFAEGVLVGALKPGTICQMDPTVALAGGRHSFKAYDRASSGDRPAGAIWVLLPSFKLGKTAIDAEVSGERAEFYSPQPGEELNCLMADIAGTADDHVKGELMSIQDATGKLIASSGQSAPFQLLESVTDPVADQLVWVSFGGF